MEIDPLQAKAYFNLGVVFDESEQVNQKAIDAYDQALKIEPNYIDAIYNQAIACKNRRRTLQEHESRKSYDNV